MSGSEPWQKQRRDVVQQDGSDCERHTPIGPGRVFDKDVVQAGEELEFDGEVSDGGCADNLEGRQIRAFAIIAEPDEFDGPESCWQDVVLEFVRPLRPFLRVGSGSEIPVCISGTGTTAAPEREVGLLRSREEKGTRKMVHERRMAALDRGPPHVSTPCASDFAQTSLRYFCLKFRRRRGCQNEFCGTEWGAECGTNDQNPN